jgi:hypothetical protein
VCGPSSPSGGHAIALAHGGTDEGAPGERYPGFYAGRFRDSDGNKLHAFVIKEVSNSGIAETAPHGGGAVIGSKNAPAQQNDA